MVGRGNIWANDGGVYLGRRVVPALSYEETERLGKEARNLPTHDEPLRGR
jgi:hypothetical protein